MAEAADVRLAAIAGSIVPVRAAAPDLGAVLVASAVALRGAVLPVVRLAVGPVLESLLVPSVQMKEVASISPPMPWWRSSVQPASAARSW